MTCIFQVHRLLFMTEEARGQWQSSVLIAEESQVSKDEGEKRSKCQLSLELQYANTIPV